MNYKARHTGMLLLTAMIWGSAFVAQRAGMEHIGAFTMNSIRSLLGAIVLLPVIKVMDMQKAKKNPDAPAEVQCTGKGKCIGKGKSTAERDPADSQAGKQERRTLVIGGVCCGIALAAASSLQQIGLIYTTAGKAGFITALYILIVPLMGLFLRKKVGAKTWAGVGLAVAGMYFLSIGEGFRISRGDFLVFLCAIVFSVHILVIDYFSPKVDGVKLSCIQFLVCGVICFVPMVLFEKPDLAQILTVWVPIAYAGVMSCGVAYTLQIIGQKGMDPTVASLLLSLESVFAALTGWLILDERLSGRELFGCGLVFTAIILAQLPQRETRDAKEADTSVS